MTQHKRPHLRTAFLYPWLLVLCILHAVPNCIAEPPGSAAISDFNAYVLAVESRLARQHRSQNAFLASASWTPEDQRRLQKGELILDQLTPASAAELPGVLLHHWRGTAFVAGAKVSDFERLMRDFHAYPQHFCPQVLQTRVLSQRDNHFEVWMRVRQRHVLTVVMDTTYEVTFGRLDDQHGYSISRSIRTSEIESPGTASERALSPDEEHGFL